MKERKNERKITSLDGWMEERDLYKEQEPKRERLNTLRMGERESRKFRDGSGSG